MRRASIASVLAAAILIVVPSSASAVTLVLTTNASPDIELGGSIFDVATVTSNGTETPTGDVEFSLYGPDDPVCSTVIFSSTVPLDSNATATSAPFTPTQTGVYRWRADYAGTGIFEGATLSTLCNEPDESVVVTPKQLFCKGELVTLSGTEGSDELDGTPGRDVISALGGKDQISGLAGKDLICGGKGKDTLRGGKGKDKLLGQGGKDKLVGGGGKDVCKGGKKDDSAKKCEVEKSI